MASGPKCLNCGSSDMIFGGFTSFHWRHGRWVEQRGVAHIADGAPLHCQSCGRTYAANHEQPFNLREGGPL